MHDGHTGKFPVFNTNISRGKSDLAKAESTEFLDLLSPFNGLRCIDQNQRAG